MWEVTPKAGGTYDAASFYSQAYTGGRYCLFAEPDNHYAYSELRNFLTEYDLHGQKCLEVGSGRGAFQNIVSDYTGIDLADSVRNYYRKPFHVGSAEELPFDSGSFDVIWSITVLEHVPDPEKALSEMIRVLKNQGLIFLKPAWNCRPWICEGIPVRSWSSLSLRQKLIKLTLPVRDSVAFRASHTLPLRMWRSLSGLLFRRRKLAFRRLKADYSTFWMVDSDACSSIDPFDAIQWFQAGGHEVLSHPTWSSAFLSRSEPLVVRVRK